MSNHAEWLLRAKSNLALAKIVVSDEICREDLCFQAQQAAEKAIKAFLLFHDVEAPKIHNMVTLLGEVAKYSELPQELKDVVILNDYAVQTRYPGEYTPVSEQEYHDAVKVSEYCVKWVENKIKKMGEEKSAIKIG